MRTKLNDVFSGLIKRQKPAVGIIEDEDVSVFLAPVDPRTGPSVLSLDVAGGGGEAGGDRLLVRAICSTSGAGAASGRNDVKIARYTTGVVDSFDCEKSKTLYSDRIED